MTGGLVLAIDQGTTSTRAIAYDGRWRAVCRAARRLETRHPRPGWAEQDPDEILASVVDVVARVLEGIGGRQQVAAVGLANQGETVVAWDRLTGVALGPAVLWSCRRSEAIVERLRSAGYAQSVHDFTGLPLDAYFSAGKIRWLIENLPDVARAARAGRLAVGTVDAWLTARLGGPARTDPSTASRTQLFGLRSLAWEDNLVDWWGVPRASLPDVGPSFGELGTVAHARWGGELPLSALLCDQQAALMGHGGARAGTVKATYGTGVFVLATVGPTLLPAPRGILQTVAWVGPNGRPVYALDGGVFSAGSLLEWLHSGIGVVDDPARLDRLASRAPDSGGVALLPALAGLGAPWWRPQARVVIAGLSAATRRANVARAAIDAIAHRVADVVEAMAPALPDGQPSFRVDGGLTRSELLLQRQADLLGLGLEVAATGESTALGVGLAAAIGAGRLDERDATAIAGTARRVEPAIDEAERLAQRAAWSAFVEAAVRVGPQPAPRGRVPQQTTMQTHA